MKSNFLHSLKAMALLLLCSMVLTSCDSDDDGPTNLVQFQNNQISGAQEVPANTSAGTGRFSGTFNKDTKVLTYNITFSGVTPTAMHFHKGATGVSGPVVIPIGSAPYTSPVTGATAALTADQEKDLMAGTWYVNIHSAQFPGGEIRGQILP